MAQWDIDWIPQKVAAYETNWNTLVTPFESGKEQRRQKWTRKKHKFRLSFDAVSDTIVDEIRVFYDSMKGSATTFYFHNFMQTIGGTRITLDDGGGAGGIDQIIDSSAGWITKGFGSNYLAYIYGSTAGNNMFATISSLSAASLLLPAGTLASSETANADLDIYCSYTVRFDEDAFENNFLYTNVAETRTIVLDEVI